MTRTKSRTAAVAWIGVLAVLSGCATTGTADRTASQSQSTNLPSLRLSDVDQGAANPAKAGAEAGFARVEIPNQPQVSQAIDLTSETDDLF